MPAADDPPPATQLPAVQAEAAQPVRIYTRTEMSRELRQAEIISGVIQYVYDPVAEEIEPLTYQYVVIISQDCDLLQDFNATEDGRGGDLNGVIVYGAIEAGALLAEAGGRDIRKRIMLNKDERYHLLQRVELENDLENAGIPSLIIDFRKLFTLSPKEIYRQCSEGGNAKRRTRLETPYKEHLQSRAAFYLARIGLPEQHKFTE